MIMIDIKPLSVNDAWRGQRFKTDKYKTFEEILYYELLPKNILIPEGPLEIYLEWGFSNMGGDWDNPIKPLADVLQKKYEFNDNRIHKGTVMKKRVKQGKEYIAFRIDALSESSPAAQAPPDEG